MRRTAIAALAIAVAGLVAPAATAPAQACVNDVCDLVNLVCGNCIP